MTGRPEMAAFGNRREGKKKERDGKQIQRPPWPLKVFWEGPGQNHYSRASCWTAVSQTSEHSGGLKGAATIHTRGLYSTVSH